MGPNAICIETKQARRRAVVALAVAPALLPCTHYRCWSIRPLRRRGGQRPECALFHLGEMSLGIRDQPRGNLWVRVVDPATRKTAASLLRAVR
jgi:hypothetical protein